MFGILDYFWRLVPANPILLRVIENGGKRRRDLFIRCAYLGILVVFVTISLLSSSAGADLAKLANTSYDIFQKMSYLQLVLVALIAPVFTAGAITQERDNQNYDILLSTPLTNGQIVLGSLLSRMFFVIALLVSGIPVFAVTQIFGGVAISAIVRSFAVAAATAFVTGALAMAIATLKVGTRRTIFGFYLFIVTYLAAGVLLGRLDSFKIALVDGAGKFSDLSSTSWLTGINPFLALRSILFDRSYLPPELTQLPPSLRAWPYSSYLTNPAGFFVGSMFLLSFLLVIPSIVLLRRLAQNSVPLRTWLVQLLRFRGASGTRKPRTVWSNPVAWREARTKASAARAVVLRYAFVVVGLLGAILLCAGYALKQPVTRWVDTDSYDPAARMLTVYTETQAKTYRVWPNTIIMLQDRVLPIGHISRKLVVAEEGTTPDQKGLALLKLSPVPRRIEAGAVRQLVMGITFVELAVILLIVTNAAASTVTREKEDGTLDLLLSTPITSRFYIWGKLRGLVSFVLPLVAVPVASACIFVIYDIGHMLISGDMDASGWIVLPEAILLFPAMFTIVAAFAAILGMQMSLRCRTTVMAVMSSVGIVAGVCGTLGWCGYNLLDRTSTQFSLALSALSPFTLLMLMIDPQRIAPVLFETADLGTTRVITFVFALVGLVAYTLGVWAMYRSMIRNFDMTIRRQSR